LQAGKRHRTEIVQAPRPGSIVAFPDGVSAGARIRGAACGAKVGAGGVT
jgi:hypothetical protein